MNRRFVKVAVDHLQYTMSLQNPPGMNPTGRDNQRQKVYDAEVAAMNQMPYKGADVTTPILYRARVNDIMASEFIRLNFPEAAATQVKVEFSNGLRGANANAYRIRSSTKPWVMREMILIHELSHVICRREYGHKVLWTDEGGMFRSANDFPIGTSFNIHVIAGHGPEYAEIYMALVREFMGGLAALHLAKWFNLGGVVYEAPRILHGRSAIKFTEHQDEEND